MEEASGPPVEIWPDNLDATNVFIAMATQWRVGFSGAVGLDYAALPSVLDLMAVPKKSRAEIFENLRVMEDAALEVMRESNKVRGG